MSRRGGSAGSRQAVTVDAHPATSEDGREDSLPAEPVGEARAVDHLPTWAVRLLKLLLFALLFYALFTLTIMIGSADTGSMEKVVLAVLTVGVYALAVPVHRIRGSRR